MAIKKSLAMAVVFAGLALAEENFSTRTVDLFVPMTVRTGLTGELVSVEERLDQTTYLVGCFPPTGQEEDYEGPCMPQTVLQGPKTFSRHIEWPGIASEVSNCDLAGTTSAHCTAQKSLRQSLSIMSVSTTTDLVGSEFPEMVPVTITGTATSVSPPPTSESSTDTDTGLGTGTPTPTATDMETETSTAGAAQITGWAAAGAAVAVAAIGAAL